MSNEAQIQTSYDVSNAFFRLFLDERMNYSCAVWQPGDTLEQAQVRKLAWLHDAAAITPDKRVLDIGCGWGANLEYLVRDRGVRSAHGITLSTAQHQHLVARALPNVGVDLVSYLDYAPERPFDAIESIGMFEHIATPAEARTGKSVAVYREYFRRAHAWSRPGAQFALQTVMRVKVPRDPEDLRALAWVGREIFPGAISPRLEEIAAGLAPYWEVLELKTRRLHYAQTCAAWRERLRRREAEIRERFGAEVYERYDRYLGISQISFEKDYASLAQFSLRRMA